MLPRLDQGIWRMDAAEQAYEPAKAEIARVKAEGKAELAFTEYDLSALERLPDEIAELKDLSHLDLRGTRISAIDAVAELKRLEILNLDDLPIYDISPLSEAKGLRLVFLHGTPVSDSQPLSEINSLEGLYADRTEIDDVSDLYECHRLSELSLAGTPIKSADSIALLNNLGFLYLNNTEISDLAPLQRLTKLIQLSLNGAMCSDLRPLIGLNRLEFKPHGGLAFKNTPATLNDAKLADLARLENDTERTRKTLAYLRSLPPWPDPYTPAATPDGSPPKAIGGVPERAKIKTAQTQVQHLIRNAMVTRISAQSFATQIEEALSGVPATNGNELSEPLQTMQDFAAVLRNLAPETTPPDDPLETAHMELRISQLEQLVDRLTRQLADETKAREAAEALAKKEGFVATHNNAFAAEAGKWNARLICIGVPSAAFYFLGADNPLAILLSKVMAGAIK